MNLPWRGSDRGRHQAILLTYSYDRNERTSKSVYLIRHNSVVQQTALEQEVTIESDAYGSFKPIVALDDFPRGLSERESMLKLADWLHRLGVAIEDNWSQP